MHALDTNILVYAHNVDSPRHLAAKAFLETKLNQRDAAGNHVVCIPSQGLLEFLNTITWSRLESPLPLKIASGIVRYYMESGVPILYPKSTQLQSVLELLQLVTSRKNIFDVGLAATLKDNGVRGLYTVNVKDFRMFNFLEVVDPLRNDGT